MKHRHRSRLRDLAAHEKGWRWWIIRHTPAILIDYLFECLIAAAGVITGAVFFAGLNAESAVIRQLPHWQATLYGVMLLGSATAVVLGLLTQTYGTTVAYGLRVMALACAVYAIAAVNAVGWTATSPIATSVVLGSLAAWRGFLLHSTFLYFRDHPELRQSDA